MEVRGKGLRDRSGAESGGRWEGLEGWAVPGVTAGMVISFEDFVGASWLLEREGQSHIWMECRG